jgi:hypothetical protein
MHSDPYYAEEVSNPTAGQSHATTGVGPIVAVVAVLLAAILAGSRR